MGESDSNRRQLGLFSATAAVIATMIGAGIWGTTGSFAFKLGTDTAVLLVWLFCGLLALTGALSLGELGGMMPRAGGCYIYTRHIYGSTAGYLAGVLSSLLAFVGAMGFIALLLGHYVQQFFPDVASPVSASVAVVLFTAIHCSGLRKGTWVNNIFTLFKIGVIIAFIIAGLNAEGRAVSIQSSDATLFSTVFAAAMISASFAYLGWETTTFIGGEVKNPGRILPWSLILGTVAVTTLYLLINWVYLHAQAPSDMVLKDAAGKILLTDQGEKQGIGVIGPHVSEILFGEDIRQWFNGMVIVVLLSSISTITMIGGRVLFAMAEGKQLPAFLEKLNNRQVPANALLTQGFATLVFIWAANNFGTLGDVLDYIGLPLTIIMGTTVAGVIVLRQREPEIERPFRVPLYPFPPILFIILALWMTISVAIENWQTAVASAATVAVVWLLKPVLAQKDTSTAE